MTKNKAHLDANASPGKWIEGLSSEMRVTDAARHILDLRLGSAIGLFEHASETAGEDPDDLRKARVATRRARASIDAFRGYLPNKTSKRLRKQLKAMRSLAGDPRSSWIERDALLDRAASAEDASREALAFVAGRLDSRRLDGLEKLRHAGEAIDLDAYREDAAKCLKRLGKEKTDVTLREHAGGALSHVERAMNDAANSPLDALEALHAFRIDIKRLRYTYEIFRCCIGNDRFERVYPLAKETQDRLGEMNDLHETAERLRSFVDAGDLPAPIDGALASDVRSLEHERDEACRSFLAWWSDPEEDAPSILRTDLRTAETALKYSSTLPANEIERSIDTALRVANERTQDNGSDE